MAGRRLGFWRRFAVVVVIPPLSTLTRRDWRGLEYVPERGPVIVVANHISHADPLMAAHFVYRAGRWPQFLAKASLFRLPILGWLLRRTWQIPVHRGTADAANALVQAREAIMAGGAVVIYPEGTTTREPHLWPMQGKTGAARLALTTGAPVVPLVMWGPQEIFDPRTQRLRLWRRTSVLVQAGPPIDLSAWHSEEPTPATLHAATDEIMYRLRDMLAAVRGETAPPLWSPRADNRSVDAEGKQS